MEEAVVSVIEILDENTEIHKINNETYIFNKKGKNTEIPKLTIIFILVFVESTYEPINLQYEDIEANNSTLELLDKKSPLSPTDSSCSTNSIQECKRLWTRDLTLYFINLVSERDEQFQTCVKKHIWTKISSQLNEEHGTTLTWQQCETKWKGLTKIYREIVDHNNTSGKQRRKWEFFDAMHAVLFKKPEILPVATCSSSSGLQVNKSGEKIFKKSATDNEEDKNEETVQDSNFVKKRKSSARSNSIERRHKEKMMRQDCFNNLFQKYIDILQSQQSNRKQE